MYPETCSTRVHSRSSWQGRDYALLTHLEESVLKPRRDRTRYRGNDHGDGDSYPNEGTL